MQQTEEIVWHGYPELPTVYKTYLVHSRYDNSDYFITSFWCGEWIDRIKIPGNIIAWSEEPEGYKAE